MLHALVVERDRAAADQLAAVLRRAGFRTRTARGTSDALASRPDPDLVVCDLTLPDGSTGPQLLAALRDRGAVPQAVFLAPSPTYEECRSAWRAGALDLLARPCDPAELSSLAARAAAATSAPSDELSLRLPATSEHARFAVRELLAFALRHGASPASRARLGGAAAEVLDNAVRHAYPVGAGEVRVSARQELGDLVVRISDSGIGTDSLAARLDEPRAALPSAPRLPGGLARAAALVESLLVDGSESGTRVTLRIGFAPAALDAGCGSDLSDFDYLDPTAAKRVLRAVERRADGELFNVPPAIAVAIGRMLAGATPSQLAQSALWS